MKDLKRKNADKFISRQEISPVIDGYYIDTFDFINNTQDRTIFFKLLEAFFSPAHEIYVVAHGSALEEQYILQVKEKLISADSWFEASVDYSESPTVLIRLNYSRSENENIISLWNYFKNIRLFSRLPDLEWETFCSYAESLFDPDPEARKMFTFNFMNFIFIKGSGGESIMINHKKDYKIPDIFTLV